MERARMASQERVLRLRLAGVVNRFERQRHLDQLFFHDGGSERSISFFQSNVSATVAKCGSPIPSNGLWRYRTTGTPPDSIVGTSTRARMNRAGVLRPTPISLRVTVT